MLRCIKNSVDAGHITLDAGQQVQQRIDEILRRGIGPARARELVAQELEAERFEKKRRALLTEGIRQAREKDVLGHHDLKGQADPAAGYRWLVENHGEARFESVDGRREAILAEAQGKLDALLDAFKRGAVTGDKRRVLNGQVKARLDSVVRELFGEDSGDQAAKGLAQTWGDVAEDLRQRFNAAGGAVRKLDKWGLPQAHSQEALLRVGPDAWIKRIADDAYAVDWKTGNRVEGAELVKLLTDADTWGNITSDGWMTREASGQRFGQGALFSRHADHRFLHFKSADKWLAYQRDFGEGDPFASMMGHVSSMARDIAAMEILGPNPGAMREYLKQLVEKQAATVRPIARRIADQVTKLRDLTARLDVPIFDGEKYRDRLAAVHRDMGAIRDKYRPQLGGKPSRRDRKKLEKLEAELRALEAEMAPFATGAKPATVRDGKVEKEMLDLLSDMAEPVPFPETSNPRAYAAKLIDEADRMWDHYTGTLNAPVDGRTANVLATGRNLVTASALGSAAISALTDAGFDAFARAYVGLPVKGAIGGVVKLLAEDNRRYAIRSGLILDSALHAMHQGARYAGSLDTRTISGFLADRVLAASGLSAITQSRKHAFGLEFMGTMADQVALELHELPGALRRTLERHGFTPDEWNKIRAARLDEPEPGATFLRPNEIREAAGRPLADKYISMILAETRYAVPEGTLRSRALLHRERPGTLVGELSRSFAQFKTFGVTVVMMQSHRMMEIAARDGRARGAGYAAGLLLATTALGALALQVKELVNGRDPRDMNSKRFWGAAALQGGGLGIYGDFLFAGVNRFGGGLAGTIAGPLADRVDRGRNTTIGNVLKVADEDGKSNLGRDVVQAVRTWAPGSSLWYARLAWERVVLDRMQEQLDPAAHDAFRRKLANRQRDYKQGFWWAPGEAAPRRAPQF